MVSDEGYCHGCPRPTVLQGFTTTTVTSQFSNPFTFGPFDLSTTPFNLCTKRSNITNKSRKNTRQIMTLSNASSAVLRPCSYDLSGHHCRTKHSAVQCSAQSDSCPLALLLERKISDYCITHATYFYYPAQPSCHAMPVFHSIHLYSITASYMTNLKNLRLLPISQSPTGYSTSDCKSLQQRGLWSRYSRHNQQCQVMLNQ